APAAVKSDNPLQTRLAPDSMTPAVASMMHDQNLTVGKGTLIPCGTINEINTTLPGMVSCRVSHDVYSINGKVRLIDKGALAEGEVTSALQYGQKRIFVNWLRLRNPEGVTIDLLSPGTTPLGGSGIKGKVNTHFWARFGDAIMVSIITNVGQMMVQAITNLASKPGTTSISTTSSDTDSVAGQVEKIILTQTSNVPPSLYVQQAISCRYTSRGI
uniref:TrbI/VirB10 family protein n=1 Tax=Komagataeibacter kakiaceti TaxID=943261 RepID=UPI0011DD8C94